MGLFITDILFSNCWLIVSGVALGTLLAGCTWIWNKLYSQGPTISYKTRARPLGIMERVFFRAGQNNMSIICYSVLLSSKCKLQVSHVKEVLSNLCKKHPLLNVRVKSLQDQLWFVPVENTTLPLKVLNDDKWEHIVEEELITNFNGEAHLWRAKFLPNITYNDSSGHKSAMIFAFSHCIADGMSCMRLLDDFLNYLADSIKGQSPVVTSLPMIEPLGNIHFPLSVLDKVKGVILWFLAKSLGMSPFVTLKNIYVETFDLPMNKGNGIKKCTRILPRQFSTKVTSNLIQECKRRGVKVHGAIVAAGLMAFAKFWENKKQKYLELCSSHTINVRNHPYFNVSSENLGTYLSSLRITQKVPIYEQTPDEFWNLGRNCSEALHDQIKKNTHINVLKFLAPFADMKETCTPPPGHGRYESVILCTNVGDCSFLNRSEDSPVRLLARYAASSEHNRGGIFTNTVATIENKLFLTVGYYPHITTKETAEVYAANLCEILNKFSSVE